MSLSPAPAPSKGRRSSRRGDRDSREYARRDHPWAAVDVVLFTIRDDRLQALLVRIKNGPFGGKWAFPGGLVGIDEPLDEAARRELREKTPVRDIYLEQLFTFGDPRRNPTRRVVSTAYFALVPAPAPDPRCEAKYADAAWFDVGRLGDLAYDHNQVAGVALERLRAKVEYTNVVYSLLPEAFTLAELQRIYEIIRGRSLDRRNFRRKILASGLLHHLPRFRTGAHRPAALFAFRARTLKHIALF